MPNCIVFFCYYSQQQLFSNQYKLLHVLLLFYSTLHICCLPVIDSKLKQQKLPAWQPIMTAGTVLPIFFAIGIAFIPLGVALLITSNNVSIFATSHRTVLRTLRISSLKIYSNALFNFVADIMSFPLAGARKDYWLHYWLSTVVCSRYWRIWRLRRVPGRRI